MSKLFVTLGERDGVRPGDLVGTIAGEAGIPGGQIGKVEVYESHTIVEVPAAESERIITALNGKMIKGRKVAVRADRPKSERKGEGDARGERHGGFDRPRSGPRDDRRPFSRDPRGGSDRPRPPRSGGDRPRPGSDRPRFGADKRSGPRTGAPPRKGRPER
jgi:ATP-dependent RNA helicase DeaD